MRKLLILFMLFSCVAAAQINLPREYIVSWWNLDDGLPQSTVNSVIQTHDGYLWLATWGGLVRFDGIKFTVFDRSSAPSIAYDRVTNLFEDKDNVLWISAEQGLLYYKNGVFKTYKEKEELTESISNFKEDKNGALWLFAGSIYKMINGHIVKQPVINNNSLRQRAMGGEGDFWLASQRSIVRLIEGKLVNCFDMSSYTKHSIWDVVEDNSGALWVATNGDGLFRFFKNNIQHFKTSQGLASNNLRKLMLDSGGNLWVTGLGGISRINTDNNNKINIYSITKENGLSDSEVINIIQDNEGNYWAGTVTGGLNKLRKSVITMFGEAQGLKLEKLLSICFRKNGNLLIGTNCGGIYELINGMAHLSELTGLLKNDCVWSVFEDSKQGIWISAGQLILADRNKVTYYSAQNGFGGSFVYSIYEDKSGSVWIGCGNGLFKYSNGVFRQYTIKDGLSANEVRSIYEDNDKNLWIGTIKGLNRMSGEKIESYTSIPGLQSNYIRSIYQDKDGTLWFGSYGGGIIRLKENKFSVITTKEGLFDNIVSHIVEDDKGFFWMGSNRGISRVSKNDLNDFADGRKKFVYSTSYGKQDGMATVETNGGFQPAAVKDKHGKIYFPTVQGLAVVNPDEIFINELAPPVHLEKFSVSGKEANIKNAYIPYDSSDIQIQYTALSYVDPKKVRFKYKIEGYDDDWINAGTRRSAYYTKLPPGEYTFKVIACNNDGIWNEHGASVSFSILPPFWMAWWFRTLIIITLLSIGPIIYYRRVTTLKKEKNRQEEFSQMLITRQEEERSRIAQELHDSLGQELLLIKNRALLGLKSSPYETKTKQQLEQISQSASSVINLVRQISHNLRPPELDRLGLTETLRSILADINDAGGVNVNSSVDNIDGLILSENEINIVRILQEAISNIYKHSGATRIDIRVISLKDKVRIIIADNGKGFIAGGKIVPANVTGSRGLGLTGMSERVHILKGILDIDSIPGGGTRITIDIPVQ